jgi:hypothetical protein
MSNALRPLSQIVFPGLSNDKSSIVIILTEKGTSQRSTVVKQPTHNPKIKGLNPATGKMAGKCLGVKTGRWQPLTSQAQTLKTDGFLSSTHGYLRKVIAQVLFCVCYQLRSGSIHLSNNYSVLNEMKQ